MKKFIVATKNKGKINEISEILKDFPYEVLSMESVGINLDIEETGSTFEENALIKAREINRITGEIVMADDSGLEVDFLNGAPGIYSARFAGENATDEEKNKKLLNMLNDVPFDKRGARFVCVIAVVFPDGTSFTVKGTCEGYISHEPKGANGFGYDPIFYVPEYQMTTAQMASEMKHMISHRGKALRLMVNELQKRYI
ncbi:XTP/dITP diphosphatase [Pseudobacteroides cellulosolvens]|uniref:dITP/XTP pyrophosphatase n=1 Tax=Pseudobacteroides cellulosolvens ATCC 35603 = DSM 2933 TaxID=398512 RepID=A0A0L6JMX7_9FIRM|nr:XTP/dITP diphosphatase [Pseudobacteroides cellulosolvens]KNY27124.1 Nucleoside-triphosphatase rdgB [Pseudobacteroides cellulosolvens ATCC 35603 = DSM 2933]